jgi:hypothetical protein
VTDIHLTDDVFCKYRVCRDQFIAEAANWHCLQELEPTRLDRGIILSVNTAHFISTQLFVPQIKEFNN